MSSWPGLRADNGVGPKARHYRDAVIAPGGAAKAERVGTEYIPGR